MPERAEKSRFEKTVTAYDAAGVFDIVGPEKHPLETEPPHIQAFKRGIRFRLDLRHAQKPVSE